MRLLNDRRHPSERLGRPGVPGRIILQTPSRTIFQNAFALKLRDLPVWVALDIQWQVIYLHN